MEPPIVRQLGVHPFAAISACSGAMVAYAVRFVAAALWAAVVLFDRRDLYASPRPAPRRRSLAYNGARPLRAPSPAGRNAS
jgi:hypothetical protein